MSAKLYVIRYENSSHIITIANSYDEAKLIFIMRFDKEPSEIHMFDKSCYISIGMPCEW